MIVAIYEEDLGRSMWSNGEKDYFSCWHEGEAEMNGGICVYDGQKEVALDYSHQALTSSFGYNGSFYWTQADENVIYHLRTDVPAVETAAVLAAYDCVMILKCINHTDNLMALKAIKDGQTAYLVYDVMKGKTLFKLPIGSGFVDLALLDAHTGLLLCEDERDISRYEDDDDYEHVFWIHFSCESNGDEAKIMGAARLYASYDSFDEHWLERRQYDNSMKFPLFDCYLYYYPESKSISSSGKYIVYYCRDIKGIPELSAKLFKCSNSESFSFTQMIFLRFISWLFFLGAIILLSAVMQLPRSGIPQNKLAVPSNCVLVLRPLLCGSQKTSVMSNRGYGELKSPSRLQPGRNTMKPKWRYGIT